MALACYFYLERSKRVAVYFVPNSVEPPLQYYPYAASYYPQAGPAAYYAPLPYPNYPSQEYYPPQGGQTSPSGTYGYAGGYAAPQLPLPQQEQQAQQQQPMPPVQQEPPQPTQE